MLAAIKRFSKSFSCFFRTAGNGFQPGAMAQSNAAAGGGKTAGSSAQHGHCCWAKMEIGSVENVETCFWSLTYFGLEFS